MSDLAYVATATQLNGLGGLANVSRSDQQMVIEVPLVPLMLCGGVGGV